MLELQHLLLGLADRPIYPLFYRLKPADLSKPDNLKCWEEYWKQKAPAWQSRTQELQEHLASSSNGSCRIQINLDIASWRDNLKRLQYRSGEVCNVFHVNLERSFFYESDSKYIQEIVDNISARLPPPMQQEINQVFEQEGSMGDDGVRVIGVYDIGGSGKSTLCKMMANFYGKEFPRRCFFLELPSPGEGDIGKDDLLLLERIKAVLGYAGTNCILHIDQREIAWAHECTRQPPESAPAYWKLSEFRAHATGNFPLQQSACVKFMGTCFREVFRCSNRRCGKSPLDTGPYQSLTDRYPSFDPLGRERPSDSSSESGFGGLEAKSAKGTERLGESTTEKSSVSCH